MCNGQNQRGDQATENARLDHAARVDERPRLSRERTWSGFWILHGMWGEPQENWGGVKQVEERGRKLTMSTVTMRQSGHHTDQDDTSAKLQFPCCLFGLECTFPVATQADKSRGLSEFANCEGG